MRVLQIAPDIGPGSGVGGVAANLEREWAARGVQTARFTMTEAHGDWLPRPGAGVAGKLALAARVGWFSTVGTVLARRTIRRDTELVSVCHNDALAGDVYVNHGNLPAAMRARGHYRWRMVRNPLHLFTAARDTCRYASPRVHARVVNLSQAEDRQLRQIYPRVAVPTAVIGNGVDLEAFRPPSPSERAAARSRLALAEGQLALLFVGHEFDRKGLPLLLRALAQGPPEIVLVVVGGTADQIERARQSARALGVAGRVHFVGVDPDPAPYFHGCDALGFPSAYESYGLVVLEALASGLPVVATPTGCVPELVHDGRNGFVVDGTAASVAAGLARFASADRAALSAAARQSALGHSWAGVAAAYLDLLQALPLRPRRR